MTFAFSWAYLYTLGLLAVLVSLKTLWAIAHAALVGEFSWRRLPDFLTGDGFKLTVLAVFALAAMVEVADPGIAEQVSFGVVKVLFTGGAAAFGAALAADLRGKFAGDFGEWDDGDYEVEFDLPEDE